MARRKSKRKPRRRTKTFNLLNAAEAIAMWNLTTTQLMGIGGLDFFTAGTQFGSRKESGWKSGVNWHKTITFKEIISGGQLGKDSAGTTISGTIMDNAKITLCPWWSVLLESQSLLDLGRKLRRNLAAWQTTY